MDKSLPAVSAFSMDIGDIMKGRNDIKYIVKKVNGKKTWIVYNINDKPIVPASTMEVDNVMKGKDGYDYIIKIINGTRTWVLVK